MRVSVTPSQCSLIKVYFRIKVLGPVSKHKAIGNVDLGLGCLKAMTGCC